MPGGAERGRAAHGGGGDRPDAGMAASRRLASCPLCQAHDPGIHQRDLPVQRLQFRGQQAEGGTG